MAWTETPDPAKNGPAPEPPPRPKSIWRHLWFGISDPLRLIGGLVLFCLVVVSATSAVIFFSAAQFQTRIAELSLNSAPLTIWRLGKFHAEMRTWDAEIYALRKTIEILSSDTSRAVEQSVVMKARLVARHDKLKNDLIRLYLKITAGAQSKPIFGQKSVDEILTEIEIYALERGGPAVTNEFNRLKSSYDEFVGEQFEQSGLEGIANALRLSLSQREEELKQKLARISRLFGATTADLPPEFVERMVNIIHEFNSLTSVWYGLVFCAAQWTSDMLVLMLVISMGLLGSALHLLAVFVSTQSEVDKRKGLSFGEYPLRLAFGAVTAIVVFIIAKAGIPVLADTSKLGGSAPINPYFVSFLAIVSGLMSDRALETIRGIATNLLRGTGTESLPRYARMNVEEVLKEANRSIEGLARVLGISVDDANKLLSGSELVPPNAQRLVAVFLDRPIRDLFSDLPP